MALPLPNTTEVQITRLCKALYNAAPGATYLGAFEADVASNGIDAFANWFAATVSSDAATLAATVAANLGLTGTALTDGTAYLTAQFAANPGKYGEVILDTVNLFSTLTSDATYGAAASAYNDSIATSYAYSINTANTTTNIATLQAADEPTAASAGAGQIFTLTTGADTITATSGDDTIYGTAVGSITTDSLQAFDQIAAGAGTDTLNVSLTGGDYDGTTTITGVENVVVRATGAPRAFDFGNMTGVTSLTNDRSSDDLTVTGVDSASASITVDRMATGKDTNIQFLASALSGTTTAASVTLKGVAVSGTASEVNLYGAAGTTDGIETLNLHSSGTASYLQDLDVEVTAAGAETMTKLVFDGSANVTISNAMEFAGTTGTIDASAATGALSVKLATADTVTVTGGAGNDTFAFTTGLTADDSVVGGDGTDTVSVTDMDTFTLANYKISGVEVIDQTSTTNVDTALVTAGASLSKVVFRENATDDKDVSVADLAAGVAVDLVQSVNGQQMDEVTLGLKDASGTADALTVSILGTSGQGAETVDDLVIANIETLNLVSGATGTTAMLTTDTNDIDDISADTTLTTINASGAANLDVVVGSEATKLTKFDAAALTGNLSVTLATGAVSLTSGSGDDTLAFGTSLNNSDVVVGGGNTKSTTEDTLTATVTSLTATTGALNVSGVERLNLTNAGTAVLNATAVTGATEIAIDGASTSTTISGLAAGTAIGLGFKGADATDAHGTVTVSLADETGTADSLTVNLNDTTDGDTNTVTLKTTAIETVNLAYSTTAAALASTTVTSTNLKAATINVTGSTTDTDNTVALGTLSTSTTKVDASSFKGLVSATAASGVATTFSTDGAQADTLTGSTAADTFTISSSAAVTHVIDGAAGSDTLNMTLGNGESNGDSIINIETVNFTVAASAAATFNDDDGAGSSLFGDSDLDVVNITGGNTLSTFAFAGTDQILVSTISTIDASTFLGTTTLAFDDDFFDNTTTITGGAATGDTITADYDDAIATIDPVVSGFEIIKLTVNADTDDSAEAYTIDTTKITGATRIELNTGATGTITNDVATTLTGLGTQTVRIGNATADYENTSTITLTLASATGTADALTVDMYDTEASATISLASAGVETLNLSANTSGDGVHTVDLSGVDATTSSTQTINLTGGVSTADFTISNVDSTARVINAVDYIGDVVLSDRGSSAMTITGGLGGDTLRMENTADVIDGGADTGDTLVIAQNAVLGGFAVDLTSTTDQVATYNGSANAAVQKGFLNVNLSGITGVFGADITANSVGSTITGTVNSDVITLGAAADTVNFSTAFASVVGSDTISSFTAGASGDILNFDISALGLAGGTEGVGAIGAMLVDSSEEIYIITGGAGYATDEAAEDAVAGRVTTDGQDMIVIYFNSTDSTAHIIHDTDAGVDGTGTTTLLGKITDITIVGSMATLTTDNIASVA